MRALLAISLAGCAATLADPAEEDGRGSATSACKRVDVVFAVDNSGSTPKEQAALRSAFPGFAGALLDLSRDVRVGLVDGCAASAAFHTRGGSGACNFDGGRSWIQASSPRFIEEFLCVADIDSSDTQCRGNDDDEQPVSAAAAALEPAWAGAGKPNADFARDDALLVVIAITDEDEHPVPGGTAQSVYERLLATRPDPTRIVFVGAGGESECVGPYGPADEATMLKDISGRFASQQRGRFSDLCDGKLDEGLRDAVDLVENACR